MIKAFIDTNVVLDALASREPFREDAEQVFLLAAEEKFQGFVTANSITDIYYLVRKNVSESVARQAIRNLLQLFTVVAIRGEDCETALDSTIEDYEDALVAVCAEKMGADYIVTLDEDLLRMQAGISRVTPTVFLENF